MRTMHRSSLVILSLFSIAATTSHAFLVPTKSIRTNTNTPIQQQAIMTDLRGGSSISSVQIDALPTAIAATATSLVAASLTSGPYGVAGLTAVASTVLLPLTQYRNLYGFSVGYGATIATIGFVLRNVFSITPLSLQDSLTAALLFYGLRLASFLFLRDSGGWKPPASRPEPSRLSRIPFALSLSLFYAFMTTPVLYALRAPAALGSVGGKIALAGTGLAWSGAVLEAVADAHKFVRKAKTASTTNATATDTTKNFVGPSSGVYSLTRHPNYTGEVLFWLGIYLAGAPSFGNSLVAWLASSAGLYGIVTIMVGAAARLEQRQAETYGGQDAYERWKFKVPGALIPFVQKDYAKKKD